MKKLLLSGILLFSPLGMADTIEEPRWDLLKTLEGVEIRLYGPSIQAITRLDSASGTSDGFRRLAGYIFGGNERSQSIAMTAPVQETLGQPSPEMAFTMPAQYALEDLPLPDDDGVTIRALPGRTVAALRFSGWATDKRVARNKAELMSVLQKHRIAIIGTPTLNQYNPPWTLPFLRRNEVAVEVQWRAGLAAL